MIAFVFAVKERDIPGLFPESWEPQMKCCKNVNRIAEICAELLEIIDDSRAHCENDEDELIHCVVFDSVQNMRRVIDQRRLNRPVSDRLDLIDNLGEHSRSVN